MKSFFISLMLLADVLSLEIVTFVNNSDTHFTIFSNNQTAANFIFSKKKCCQPNNLYNDVHSPSLSSNFTLFKDINDILPLNEITLLLNKKHNITDKLVTYSVKSDPNIIELQIFSICSNNTRSSSSSSTAESQLGNSGIITVSFNLNDVNYHFDYYRICNNDNKTPGIIISIISIAFILLLMTIIIFISTHFTLDTDLITEFKEKLNFDWKYGLILLLISLLSVFLLSSLKSVIQYVLSIGMLCILIVTVYLTSASLSKSLLHLQSIPSRLRQFAKKNTLSIKTYKLFSILLSIALVILWAINPNWILLDILLFTCVFASVSFLSIQNYQSLTLICLCFLFYDLFFLFYSISYTKALEEIDQPIKCLFPKLNNNDIYNPCYFISFIDIVIVCFFVKYSKCFDVVKGNISYDYYKTSVCIYFIGIFVTIFLQLFLKTNQVFLFPLEILLLLGLIGVSISKREFRNFWNGENDEEMHKVVSDIISNKAKNEDMNEVRYAKRYKDANSTY